MRIERAYRFVGIGVVVAGLLVTACGSDDKSDSGDSGGEATPVEVDEAANAAAAKQIVTASDALVERWDDEGAFFVVMSALDEGYSITQIVEAAPAGDVQANGTIAGVEPDGEPLGLLGDETATGAGSNLRRMGAGSDDGGDGSSGDETPRDRTIESGNSSLAKTYTAADGVLDRYYAAEARRIEEEELAEARDALFEADVTTTTMALSARGYSAAQIIEAIADLDVVNENDGLELPPGFIPGSPCLQIVVDGQVVEPELPPALGIDCPPVQAGPVGDGADGGSQADAADEDRIPVGSYTGELTGDVSEYHALADENDSISFDPVELTITEDGWSLSAGYELGIDSGCGVPDVLTVTITGSGDLTSDGSTLYVHGDAQSHSVLVRSGDCNPIERADDTEVPVSASYENGEVTAIVDEHPVQFSP